MAVRYGTFRICVLRTSHLEPYRTNVPYPYHYKKSVPYFLAKIEAYRTVTTYRTAILAVTNPENLLGDDKIYKHKLYIITNLNGDDFCS